MSIDIDHALTFFDFVRERHNVYERRQAGWAQDLWTGDQTLLTRKFTNVFRWLDPGSQFVLTDLAPDVDEPDFLFRCVLYRLTNWPDTWRWMREQLGRYPMMEDLPVLLDLLQARRDKGLQMFSGAYMILPQPGRTGDKLEHLVEVVANSTNVHMEFANAKSQEERHTILTSVYGIGPFLGLQILTDFMYEYGNIDSEDEFVVPGPGSNRGTRLFAPGHGAASVIRWAHGALSRTTGCPELLGRRPSVMDVQNCFCEYSKYVKGPRTKIYRPAHPGPLPEPILPTAYRR